MKISLNFLKIIIAAFLIIVVPNYAKGFSVDFSRLYFDMASLNPSPNSNWGEVDLSFTGTSDYQYFNLEIDGVWQIQNAPILSIEGPGNTQSLSFNFNIGDATASAPDSIDYRAFLTEEVLSDSDLSGDTTNAELTSQNVTVGGDDTDAGGLGLTPILPLLGPWIGLLPVDFAFNPGMVNQDVGVNECTPGAFSNSLKWLDDKYDSITIPDEKKSVEGLKTPLEWDADGTPHDAWEGKKEALKDYVTTSYFLPEKIEDVIKEMKDGEDIELDGKGHYAVVTGIIEHLNGNYTLFVTHDTDQKNIGGTKTQAVMFDAINNKFLTSVPGFYANVGIDGFVSESPVPEPATLLLFGLGLVGLAGFTKRRLKK